MKTDFIETISGILGSITFVIGIILFIFLGIPSMKKTGWPEVTAEVVDNIPFDNDGNTSYYFTYGYTYNDGYYETTDETVSSSFEKEIGSKEKMYVNPYDPYDTASCTLISLLSAVPFIVIAMGAFFSSIFISGKLSRIKGTDYNPVLVKVSGAKTIGTVFIGESVFFMILFFSARLLPLSGAGTAICLGIFSLFILLGIVLILNENRIYRGKRKPHNIPLHEFTNQQDMIDTAVKELNRGNHPYVVTASGSVLKIGIKWMDGIYIDAPLSVNSASCYFEHIIKLNEKNRTYAGMDVSTNSTVNASMLHGKYSINGKAGIVHRNVYMKVLGYDRNTGKKGLIDYTLNTDDLRGLLDEYIESYGYKRKS